MSSISCCSRLRGMCSRKTYRYILRHNLVSFLSTSSIKTSKTKTASSTYNVMHVFDRHSKKLQRERAAQSEDYSQYEYLKEEMGWRVADRIFDIKRTFHNAVELGAGRGYVSRHLTPDSVTHVTLLDTSQTNLDKAIVGEGVKFRKVLMDEEVLDLPDGGADLVVSSLCLHWVNDLPGLFDRVMRCLKPDGVFMACLFGDETLLELRQALQLAETERLGGMHQRVSPMTRISDVGGLLTSAGFTLQTADGDETVVWYPSAWHVMRDLRGAGEASAAHARPRLTAQLQFAAAAIYQHMYGAEFPGKGEAVPATYRFINFVGWKPDPSQPAPLQRGSGQVSLKDIHRIDEIVKNKKEIELTEEDMK